jgi:hypothetical protein
MYWPRTHTGTAPGGSGRGHSHRVPTPDHSPHAREHNDDVVEQIVIRTAYLFGDLAPSFVE